jgi:hypothetical protein
MYFRRKQLSLKLSQLIRAINILLLMIFMVDGYCNLASPSDSLLQNIINTEPFHLEIGDPIPQSDTPSCIIPFTRIGKLILVQARADNMVGNFILDTGSPQLVLNTTYFRDYPLIYANEEVQTTITGNAAMVERTMIGHFTLGTLHYSRAEADLANLGHIESSRGIKILGLLGVALFKKCELIIDYQKNEIHLHLINNKEKKYYKHELLKDDSKFLTFPFDLKDNRILIKSSFSKKNIQFVIDYAAESNIIDSRLPSYVLDSIQINGRVLLAGVGTKKIEALTGDFNGFKLGTLHVAPLPVIITNLDNTCFGATDCIDGVLGYDFLSRYQVVFNFVLQKMYVLNEQ